MFNTMCGCEVQVSGVMENYTLHQFIRVVEDTDARYPQFRIAVNLMKYLKDNLDAIDPDELNLENCQKLFEIMDKDGTGELDISEMIKMFLFMGMHKLAWFETYKEYGTLTSADELQSALKRMDEEHKELDLGNRVVGFLAMAAEQGGRPDIDSAEETEEQPDEEVANKKALLVGINYIGSSSELGGCINDVRNQMQVLTEHFGFAEENILLLTEDQDEDKRPTKARIQEGFQWLFDGASEGDELFFQYSGHGSQCSDRTGQEPDGKNECICPLDCQDGPWPEHVILDNEIYETFYQGLPDGVRCICIFDCCHSGTIADLQCTRAFSFEEADKSRYLEPPEDIAAELESAAPGERMVKDRSETEPNKKIWTFSGCQDNQTSADATINGQRQGAMTWALTLALVECGYHCSYMELLNATRKHLKGRYTQIPALSTTCEEYYQRPYLESKAE